MLPEKNLTFLDFFCVRFQEINLKPIWWHHWTAAKAWINIQNMIRNYLDHSRMGLNPSL